MKYLTINPFFLNLSLRLLFALTLSGCGQVSTYIDNPIPAQSPIQSFSVYQNNSEKYSINYPFNWLSTYIEIESSNKSTFKNPNNAFEFFTTQSPEKTTLSELATTYETALKQSTSQVQKSTVLINRKQGIKFQSLAYGTSGGIYITIWLIEHLDSVYVFEYNHTNSTDLVGDSIIQSLTFSE